MPTEPQITIFVDPKGLDEINDGLFPSNYSYSKSQFGGTSIHGGGNCYIPIQLSVADFQNRKDIFYKNPPQLLEKRLLKD